VRASEATCAVTAATAANMHPDAVHVAARTALVANSPPASTVAMVATIPRIALAMIAMARATPKRVSRPITPEASNSA